MFINSCPSVIKQHNMVPATWQWCLAAGKVTVGLASHWPRVTDISGSPPTGSRPGRGRWAPAYVLLAENYNFTLLITAFPFNALTQLVGRQEGHPACIKLGVGLLMIWRKLCTSYSSSCHNLTTDVLSFNKIWNGDILRTALLLDVTYFSHSILAAFCQHFIKEYMMMMMTD